MLQVPTTKKEFKVFFSGREAKNMIFSATVQSKDEYVVNYDLGDTYRDFLASALDGTFAVEYWEKKTGHKDIFSINEGSWLKNIEKLKSFLEEFYGFSVELS